MGDATHVILQGWEFRSQMLSNGTRQITDVHRPGRLLRPHPSNGSPPDLLEACGRARVAVVSMTMLPTAVRALVETRKRMQQAEMMRRLRAGLVSSGRQNARERVASFVMERMRGSPASISHRMTASNGRSRRNIWATSWG